MILYIKLGSTTRKKINKASQLIKGLLKQRKQNKNQPNSIDKQFVHPKEEICFSGQINSVRR